MAVASPAWLTLKTNIKTALQAVATAEAAVSADRGFVVTKNRWRPWIENQQNTNLVNIMIDGVRAAGGGTRRSTHYTVTVNIDMYVLGNETETTDEGTGEVSLSPADEDAADRLDLLTAQVLYGITRMVGQDFGFPAGMIDTRALQATLQIYTQEGSQQTGSYAPARWSFDVTIPYTPADDAALVAVTEIGMTLDRPKEPTELEYTIP